MVERGDGYVSHRTTRSILSLFGQQHRCARDGFRKPSHSTPLAGPSGRLLGGPIPLRSLHR